MKTQESQFDLESLKYINVMNHKMFTEPADILQLSTKGIYEPYETSLMKEKIKKGSTVVDIGANIGYYSLIMAEAVGPTGKVYCFEPDPYNFAILEKNIKINGYENIIAIQKAVSNESGISLLYLDKGSIANHSLFHSSIINQKEKLSIKVETIILDEYLREDLKEINFLKMDIQAGEWNALQGMLSLLENDELVIFMEYWPHGLKMTGTDCLDCLNLFKRYGFKLFDIQENMKSLVFLGDAKYLSGIPSLGVTNLLIEKKKEIR